MKYIKLSLIALCAVLASCGTSSSLSSYEKFSAREDYKKTYDTYTNQEALAATDRSKTSVKVSVKNQRMQLKEGETVLIDTPCTTGRAGKRTPYGSFKLYDRNATKRSNVYGTIYRNGKRVCGGHRYEKCPGVSGKYVGAPLPYWQRLTGDGIGMHASKGVKRYPASGGCIRVQPSYAKLIFNKTKSGTRIVVGD